MHPQSHKVLMVNMFNHSSVLLYVLQCVCVCVCVMLMKFMENWLVTLFAHCNQISYLDVD